jgi:hypothetical protein
MMNTLLHPTLLLEAIALPPVTTHELKLNHRNGSLRKTAIIDLKKHFIGQNGPLVFLKQICSTLIPERNYSKTTEQYWIKKQDHWESIPQLEASKIAQWEFIPAETPDFAF